jgi:eukaryotic-like serine/threonine-protein kinase
MDILNARFQIEKTLGKKAGRQTLLARDLQTQDQVVIKLLTFGSEFEWDDLKLFEREAETLKSLDHPSIPKYLDYFELELPNGKGFALVQSYIEATSLEQQLKAGRSFTEAEIQQLAEELLDILNYLHRRQPAVIHRDIKPSNILLSDRTGNHVGQVYLVDFGSVQTLVAQEGGTITVVGTYGYMPPEQFGGRATPASDLYSLGATLIYLITGKHPADLPQRNLQLQFRELTTLNESLIDWLECMTEPSIENRFKSAESAKVALQNGTIRQIIETEKPKPLKPSAGPIYANAILRSGAAGFLSTIVWAFYYLFVLNPIGSTNASWAISQFFLVMLIIGGFNLGLGFLIGVVIALFSDRGVIQLRKPLQYRIILGLVTLILTTTLPHFIVATGLDGGWDSSIKLLLLLMNLCFGMSSQSFSTWFIQECRRVTAGSARNEIVRRNSTTLAVSLTKERIYWNAVWRNCAIAVPLGGIYIGINSLQSVISGGIISWQMILANVPLYVIGGSALFLAIAFLNGLATGYISSRFFPRLKYRAPYRLVLALCTTAITTLSLSLIAWLLSSQWLDMSALILISNIGVAIASQFFAAWYIRESRR